MEDKPLNEQEPEMLPKRGSGKTLGIVALVVLGLFILLTVFGGGC